MNKEQIEQELGEALQEPQTPSAEEKAATEGEKTEEEGASSTATVEILGRVYDLSNLDQVRELAKDYDRIGRNYAPLLQQVREIQAKLQEYQKKPEEEEEIDETTLNYLKKAISKLGVVTVEELQQRQEDERLENYLQSLEAEYDGSNGLPKFNRAEVLDYCVRYGILDPLAGYKLLNHDKIIEAKLKELQQTKTPPPSMKSAGEKRMPLPKKRIFGMPNSEEEIPLREAIEETLEEAKTKLAEE